MDCKECEKRQNLAFNKDLEASPPIAYVRIDNANVAIIGCDKHVAKTIERLEK